MATQDFNRPVPDQPAPQPSSVSNDPTQSPHIHDAEPDRPSEQSSSWRAPADRAAAQSQSDRPPDEAAPDEAAPEAQMPSDDDTSMFGQSLGGRREIAGGGNIQEHELNAESVITRDPLYYQRRYMGSRLHKEAGTVIARSPDNIGFFGKGDVYRGNGGILVDIDTLEKHRFPDGYRFEGDEVYANSRDMPMVLVDGELQKNLSGESAKEVDKQQEKARDDQKQTEAARP